MSGTSGTVVRAVYDIGSGSTKLLVAEVDLKTRTIARELFGLDRELIGQLKKQARTRTLQRGLNLIISGV